MQESTTIDIWPGLAPGESTSELGTTVVMYGCNVKVDITHPQMTVYPLEAQTNLAPTVLVFPGGGYEILADEHEGVEIAQWLNSFGFAAAMVRYRIPNKRDLAFADAQRAIRVLKARASEFFIDPDRIGVIGFSAGAHLAARLSTQFDSRSYEDIDSSDLLPTRPDFAILVYPAYLIDENDLPDPVTTPHTNCPPLFVMQTEDDPYSCARKYADLASTAGIQVKSAIYELGGHGYGLHPDPNLPVSQWSTEAEQWLKAQVGWT